MSERKVVITGLGGIAPTGLGVSKIWKAALKSKSGIAKISAFDTNGYTSQIAGEVDFNPHDHIPPKEAKKMDRFTQFAIVASNEALKDARLEINDTNSKDIGVIIGSGIGGLFTLEQQHKVLLESGPRRVSPFLVPMMISNMAAGQVSIFTGAKGTGYCTVSACASSAHAIGEAYYTIKRGDIKAVICGGSEAPVTPLGVAGFCALRALSTRNDNPEKASRPFDKDRDGFVIAEGAGILILESEEFAKSRNAKIYCEINGYGSTSDAFHIVQPDSDGDGAARAMEMAIKNCGISPEEVDYINAHGTSTPYNDALETLAIKKVFGGHAYSLLISSTKSMTGHLLGAAGGIESIYSIMAIKENIVPPTINLENNDPECDLNYVPHTPVKKNINTVMCNSFGFGGQNVSLLFKRWGFGD